ncbi:developmental pluripotency-associated 5 protein-like [Hyaena hyaena]|uniref:developmental pluripotency-associated 5 protein-like n=1 Tax=Hyaena hyaena TaxID=95912 RepID=UPI0019212912|nr:developmental pluripotency-associated 5 protein-like [Hyaena hyaena]
MGNKEEINVKLEKKPYPLCGWSVTGFETLQKGTLPRRKDTPPWVKVSNDLKDPELFQAQTRLLEATFGVSGSRILYIEQVSKVMLELKVLESSRLTKVVVYGSYLYKLKAKWIFQSMAERHRQRQERGMLKLEDTMKALHLGPASRSLDQVKPVCNQLPGSRI